MIKIKLSDCRDEILQIVKRSGSITGNEIAKRLSVSKAALQPELAVLTKGGNTAARPQADYFYNEEYQLKLQVEQFSLQKVKDFKAHPIVVEESTSVYDAIVQLFLEDVGTLYAVDLEGYLAGVVSKKDLLRASLGNKSFQELPVSVIMTKMPNVITIYPEETLLEAVKKMLNFHIDSLPVVKEVKGKKNTYSLLGRITKTTITRAYLELIEGK